MHWAILKIHTTSLAKKEIIFIYRSLIISNSGYILREYIHNAVNQYVEIKGQLDETDWIFIAKLIVRSTYFGHHYAHHQELKIYTDGCCLWYLAL